MVEVWWSLLGAAVPAVIAGQAIIVMKKKRAEEQRMKSIRGREKSSDDVFVCERVCTSKRMLKKVGAFSKDPIPDNCLTVCGVSELDACSDACARTVCVNQHQVPDWNDICLRRCQKQESTRLVAMDSTNPYYVHHSDQPGHMLVSTKLNGVNYQSWKIAMIHALRAKKKLGFVDGTLEMPSPEKNPSEFELWNQCNSLILTWLSHSIEPEIAVGTVHAKTARQVWEDLRDQFGQKNAPAIFRIQKAIATMSQGTMSVASYYIKLKAFWDEIELYRSPIVCNQTKEHQIEKEEDKLMQFLMGLNDSFKTTRSNILVMNPLPNVRQAYSLVVQEETQQQMNSDHGENFSIAAAVQGQTSNWKQSKSKFCEHCNRSGHTIDECRTLKYHCTHCDKDGHTEDRCRIKKGTWSSNGRNGQPQRSKKNLKGSYPSANMAESSRMPHDSNESNGNLVQGLTAEQIQQLARAVALINNDSSKSEAFVNATGLGYGEDDWLG